jgi:CRP-like cAMP-binding protein
MEIAAFLQGILGASSLALGAFVGIFWQTSQTISAAIMAFGSGTLISAIAFEITPNVYQKTDNNFLPLLISFSLGGVLFTTLSQYIDQQGGFLRKPAASRRYLLEHSTETGNVLQRTAHIEVMQQLPNREKEILAALLAPIHAEPGDVLCREGEAGDYLYMIVEGEAEVCKGNKPLTRLAAGEIFGEMSLLTGEPRSATVVALTPMALYQLDQENFSQVLASSPHLAWALSRALSRRLRLATAHQAAAEEHLERWRQQLMDRVELDRLVREEPQTLKSLVNRSAPMAIAIGTLLDNIPESATIGINTGGGQIGWSFLLAVFISNFPEALSSAIGMKHAGTPKHQILALWIGVVGLSGFFAMAGYWLQAITSELAIAIAEGVAGGAILAMLASTMMPEAYELGGSSVSYSTIAGFLLGFFVASWQF